MTTLIRAEAKKLIAQAVEAEMAEFMVMYVDQQDETGRAIVVRSGHHPPRDIQTGIRPMKVQVPKVRRRKGEQVTCRSALVPPYVRNRRRLEAALPWLYLKDISNGEMQTALEVLVGPRSKASLPVGWPA